MLRTVLLLVTLLAATLALVGCPKPQQVSHGPAPVADAKNAGPVSDAGTAEAPAGGYSSGVTEADEPAPDFTLIGTDGAELTKDQFTNKVVVLDFWSTTCEPCKEKLKKYEPIIDKYKDKGVELLAVSLDSAPEVAAGWAKQNNFPFTIVMMTDQLKADYFPEVTGDLKIPEVRIIDRDGNLRFKFDAKSTVQDMELALAELTAETVGGDESVTKQVVGDRPAAPAADKAPAATAEETPGKPAEPASDAKAAK